MTRKLRGRALAHDQTGVFDPSTGQRAFAFVAAMPSNTLFEEGCAAMLGNDLLLAKQKFIDTLAIDATFADAHILLGMALELSDQPKLARHHWQTYLQLVPHGPF